MGSPPAALRSPLTVAVVGGGLAGLAAAAVLCERGFAVELFEARRRLGGRAGSFWRDPAGGGEAGEWIDHCQHVGMACCSNLIDFCRRTAVAELFRRDETLHFFGPDGRRCDFRASRWLPAPLHLAPALLRLKFLSLADRLKVAVALLRLARESAEDSADGPTIGQWLRRQGQSPAALERFWEVVLVSALGETLDRASLPAARKVFVDGFMANRQAYCIDVPTASLREIYDRRVAEWLTQRGAQIHWGTPVAQVNADLELELGDGERRKFDFVILAVPWRAARRVLAPQLAAQIPHLGRVEEIASSPITGVHLWFDRPLMDLPHAVLVGRLAQWVFRRDGAREEGAESASDAHYYQVVISASRQLRGRDADSIIQEATADLASIWPTASEAKLLAGRVVTEREAVFSVRPGLEQLRPPQQTAIPNLMLAGDWTATGWPATMEGAVRSGYLAAEAVLQAAARPERVLVPDLPRGWLAKALLGSK